jgi:ATP-binding cassette, subfamily C (CFTR/MRP), member 1
LGACILQLFADMLEVVLHAKMSFFDMTPVGRLTNRFTKGTKNVPHFIHCQRHLTIYFLGFITDIYTTDEQLTETMRTYLGTLFAVVSTVVVISGVTPLFSLCLVPMIIFYIVEQQFFTVSKLRIFVSHLIDGILQFLSVSFIHS